MNKYKLFMNGREFILEAEDEFEAYEKFIDENDLADLIDASDFEEVFNYE